VTDEVPLLARLVEALQGSGRLVEMKRELNTFHVLPERDEAEQVLGVVVDSPAAVTLYYVWPDPVDDEHRPAVQDFATRANTNMFQSAFEFNPDTGMLSLRNGVEFGEWLDQMRPDVVAGMLVTALDDLEFEAGSHTGAVASVVSGKGGVFDSLALVTG
jgi:hypothetical protein